MPLRSVKCVVVDSVVNCRIILQGYFCNHWPEIKILHNEVELYQGPVENTRVLDFVLQCRDQNCLRFEHFGKRFGQDNIWDTSVDTGDDCKLQIVDVSFDDVSIGPKLRSNMTFVTALTGDQSDNKEFIEQYSVIDRSDGWMTFNGVIDFEFETPVYDWLIVNKFRVDKTNSQAYFSGYSDRWNYQEDQDIIDDIKKLMNFDHENRSSSSAKT